MWEDSLAKDLLWHAKEDLEQRATSQAQHHNWITPTWSWASTHLPVIWLEETNGMVPVCSVLAVNCIQIGSDKYGPLSFGELTIAGEVIECRLRRADRGNPSHFAFCRFRKSFPFSKSSNDLVIDVSVSLDRPSSADSGHWTAIGTDKVWIGSFIGSYDIDEYSEPTICLQLTCSSGRAGSGNFLSAFLLLKCVDPIAQIYERIGIGKYDFRGSWGLFSNAEERRVRIR